MNKDVRRIYAEKKDGFDIEARNLCMDIRENLGIHKLKHVRIINRYDIWGISDMEYEKSRATIFSEPPVDYVYDEDLKISKSQRAFAVEYLPGQYDQRADSASQCVQILTQHERPDVRAAKVILLEGDISDEDFIRIKDYCINPVDSREASLEKPSCIDKEVDAPGDVKTIEKFIDMDCIELQKLRDMMGLAMSIEDLKFVRKYFKDMEKRNPTITEIRVIDTYWSDHCRHTTFQTIVEGVEIEDGHFKEVFKRSYEDYEASREYVYGSRKKDICLMDMATIGMKELRKRGMLQDLDVSDEINACSIVVNADVDGKDEEWLVMFKNETHNHPTEIEPFGGAATCLGGAIRDPLSGRAYVYQAMRVTGSGDPRVGIGETLPGKLPQRKITRGAASGYSSYGNQIGLATGHVTEIYDEGFVAKRMEIGAVIGAVPRKNVVRKEPAEGDRVILLGGRTGRDGCGGATGSSKEHTEESILKCGSEVQKGNPPTERKIQRLFRNPFVAALIKRCNDFGAGGVCVAVGELADGLEIDLDAVPKKYEGLDGTELAISESQERMAVVVAKEDVKKFIECAREENLEAVEVARVTSKGRLKMYWRGCTIVDISREFLDTNGIRQKSMAYIASPSEKTNYFDGHYEVLKNKYCDLKEAWMANLKDLNVCSQRGLVERFDSTIGAGTVIMPYGGKYQATPAEFMASKIPVVNGETNTCTVMSCGYNPAISKWSPFHGAVYAIVEAVSKGVAAGLDYRNMRLTLQEYFEHLGKSPEKWGKPVSAMLGAYYAQMNLGIPAIGGKDSMSGTFKDLNVPPTLVAFGVGVGKFQNIVSGEFKKAGTRVVLIHAPKDENMLPDFEKLKYNYAKINGLIKSGKVLSSYTVKHGGLAEAVSKMCFGNRIGIVFGRYMDYKELFSPDYGSIILEIDEDGGLEDVLEGMEYSMLGYTSQCGTIKINDVNIGIDEALREWEQPLEKVFPTRAEGDTHRALNICYNVRNNSRPLITTPKPRVFIPVFPGTNCEYDTARAFETAGGIADVFIFKNLSRREIEESICVMATRIDNSQIIAIPGGFSGGDEPDGSGKFIATAFRNPRVEDAVMRLLKKRDGLMLGICNGFQALIKLGLLPYGEIRDIDSNSPTLTFNKIGRHVSRMVNTKIASTLSPWFANVNVGDIHTIAVSHGEGRFVANETDIEKMIKNGQIATQYVDFEGNPSCDIPFNPNGSIHAIEGITSPDGRILGKMGHSERVGNNAAKNIPGNKDQKIFEAGINYFI